MRTTLNIKSIIKVLGQLVAIESFIMMLPMMVCLIYSEQDWTAFAIAVLISFAVSLPVLFLTRNVRTNIKAREGFVITAVIWLVYGLFGMIPFMLSGSRLTFTDAMFETISGFTTTGMSVIRDVGVQSHGILFWRALTQWIGGLGIILFLLAMLPELNKSAGLSMFNAEATGITHDKLHPRIRQTVLSLWGIYAVVTLVSVFLLWVGPMDLFDSICHTFTAISTGGFSTHNEGVSYWHSNYVMGVIILVMLVGGINFMVLYASWKGGVKQIWKNEVARTFIYTIIIAYLLYIISFLIRGEEFTADNFFFQPLFHVLSAITSTGFTINEAEGWGSFALLITITLMLSGSCAGSTAGGIKIDRLIVIFRNLVNEVKKTVYPKRVYVVNLNGSFLQSNLISRVSAFVTLYMLLIGVLTAIITLYGYSFTDSIFVACSSVGCNGLGYGVTGVNGSYACLPDMLKWIISVVMIIGRLELFTVLVLFLPSFWGR